MSIQNYDVIIIGAGAAGLMCGIESGKRGCKTLILDHAKREKLAEKIRISGGGRCNFTNIYASPNNYLSNNPHFFKSALKQYTQYDFIAMVDAYGIAHHEKKLGQLFCDESAQQIIDMLADECQKQNAELRMETSVTGAQKTETGFNVQTNKDVYACTSLVIATGGLSIPKIGATDFGYKIAEQFGLKTIAPRAGLVPLTFSADLLDHCKAHTGLSVDAEVKCGKTAFREGLLFTHRGLSGPSILQISSYWREGEEIIVNLAPDTDLFAVLKSRKDSNPKQDVLTVASEVLPKRLAQSIVEELDLTGKLAELSDKKLQTLASRINDWRIKPAGTEGYRTAEVTLGGVDTDELSSKTMECRNVSGLYFIGEVVDVTGHLGGFNFQWAWSSGYVAGQNV